MGKKLNVIEGQRFGLLSVIEEVFNKPRRTFKCKCDCGNYGLFILGNLCSGRTKSCGCYNKDVLNGNNRGKTHGMYRTRIYNAWQGLKYRCGKKSCKEYQYYGGRGISYDKKWEKFEGFYEDMGKEYNIHLEKHGAKNTTIDRINNDGNYCKENCRRATITQQNNNKRR